MAESNWATGMWDSRWVLWLCSCPPCSGHRAVNILHGSQDLSGHRCYFIEPTAGKSYPEKWLFPPLPHGWLLASAAQTMRILTVWGNQPKKAGGLIFSKSTSSRRLVSIWVGHRLVMVTRMKPQI